MYTGDVLEEVIVIPVGASHAIDNSTDAKLERGDPEP
jgi:hypothetical protein